MEKQSYITDEEREKCRKVASIYEEDLEDIDIKVVDAGRYGFVKLQDYHFPHSFDNAVCFTNSRELFDDLWDEWLIVWLMSFEKGTPLEELDYEDIFNCLPKETQQELMGKQVSFAKEAGITL